MKIEILSEPSNQMFFNIRSETEKHILVVVDRSTQEEKLCPPLQTIIEHLKSDVTSIADYNGVFEFTKENNELFSGTSIN